MSYEFSCQMSRKVLVHSLRLGQVLTDIVLQEAVIDISQLYVWTQEILYHVVTDQEYY
jgi:hypothetical protein